jgi:hypothetical protein
MIRLEIISDIEDDIEPLIKSAIHFEITRLEIGLNKTDREIRKFENKYQVSSETFLKEYTTEDLENGDDEYISWMGEIKINEKMMEELSHLKAIA